MPEEFFVLSRADRDLLQEVIGRRLGGGAAPLQGRERRRVMPELPPGLFGVYVEKTGGSDGDQTSAASWTYTVRGFDGSTLGTGIELARPRPNGTATFQEGEEGFGVAFYGPPDDDGNTLKLWDAGEIYGSSSCPAP